MHPICSEGRKHTANSFTPGDMIMHQQLGHIFFLSLCTLKEQWKMGTSGKDTKGTCAFTACLCNLCFSVGSLEPSRVWGDRSQRQSNILKTCNQYLAAVNWRCKCSGVGNDTGTFMFCHRWTLDPYTSILQHIHHKNLASILASFLPEITWWGGAHQGCLSIKKALMTDLQKKRDTNRGNDKTPDLHID